MSGTPAAPRGRDPRIPRDLEAMTRRPRRGSILASLPGVRAFAFDPPLAHTAACNLAATQAARRRLSALLFS